jgi:hypothetical protein
MKKVRISLMAMALFLGVAGAFAGKAGSTNSNKKFVIYMWDRCDASGNIISGSPFQGTLSQAQSFYGCSGSGTRCAKAVNSSTDIYINHN